MANGKPTLGLKKPAGPAGAASAASGPSGSGAAETAKPRLTLEQQRAQYAWQQVLDARAPGGEYTALVKAAPALIVNNGLMQALAFWQSRGKVQHRALLGQLLGWLQFRGLVSAADFASAMPALYAMPSADFRRATDEALALLRWLRQLAAAAEPRS